ncbi:MAG: SEC-C metal-binding domain-containing protein [Bacteroidota bacterium]
MKQDRNDLCHCGSGKKHKNCHGRKRAGGSNSIQWVYLLLGAIVVAAGIAVFNPAAEPVPAPQQRTLPNQAGGMSLPPGPAPPGKVWSSEHGHWHDAPDAANAQTQTTGLTPQPPGEAPAGKVWSPEHGHWHDSAESGKQIIVP